MGEYKINRRPSITASVADILWRTRKRGLDPLDTGRSGLPCVCAHESTLRDLHFLSLVTQPRSTNATTTTIINSRHSDCPSIGLLFFVGNFFFCWNFWLVRVCLSYGGKRYPGRSGSDAIPERTISERKVGRNEIFLIIHSGRDSNQETG